MNTRASNRWGAMLAAATLVAVLFAGGLPAHAEFMGFGDQFRNALMITAVNEDGEATETFLDFGPPELPENASGNAQENRFKHFEGGLPPGLQMKAQNGKVLGTIEFMEIALDGDPLASLSFRVTAGSSDKTFLIRSASPTFPALVNPQAHVRADILLTDNTQGTDSFVQGELPNGFMFMGTANGTEVRGRLDGMMEIPGNPGSGATMYREDDPGWETLPLSVTQIQAEWKFTVSAHDSAEGHGSINVVPEPSTVALLGIALGALLAGSWWRRRR
jgi:hypothetical protein